MEFHSFVRAGLPRMSLYFQQRRANFGTPTYSAMTRRTIVSLQNNIRFTPQHCLSKNRRAHRPVPDGQMKTGFLHKVLDARRSGTRPPAQFIVLEQSHMQPGLPQLRGGLCPLLHPDLVGCGDRL